MQVKTPRNGKFIIVAVLLLASSEYLTAGGTIKPLSPLVRTFEPVDSALVTFDNGSLSKYSYDYDDNDKMITELRERWHNSSWVKHSLHGFKYDSIGNSILEEMQENWDGNTWINHWRIHTEYNSHGYKISEFKEYWDGSSWVNEGRYSYSFDENGNKTQIVREFWDGSSWYPYTDFSSTYDVNGNRVSEIRKVWDGSKLVEYYRFTFIYGAEGLLISYATESKPRPTADWDYHEQYHFTYDENDSLTSERNQEWDGSDWIDQASYSFAYDLNGNWVSEHYAYWNSLLWKQVFRIVFSYDANNNLTARIREWGEEGNWSNDERLIYDYDQHLNLVRVTSEEWFDNWILNDFYIEFWDSSGNRYNYIASQVDLFYRYSTTDVTESSSLPPSHRLLHNYPNPFNPITNIGYTVPEHCPVSLVVYNVAGQKVRTLESNVLSPGEYQTTWDGTDNLGLQVGGGLFFARLQVGEHSKVIKMTLIR